ncbi:MAG TPA: hypothetical protein VGI39_01825 [Polyangiaceae bacterium]|jgi:hypothetical protein
MALLSSRPSRQAWFVGAFAAASSFLCACASDSQFSVQYAPGYPKAGETVAVLGVFKDGRLSAEAWEEVSPKLSAALGSAACPVGYDEKMTTSDRLVAEAIDDYARANGITDALLEQLAPAAKGDLILVVTVAGRPPNVHGGGVSDPTTAAQASNAGQMSPASSRRGGMMPGGMGRSPQGHLNVVDRNAYELVASIYSVSDKKSVGLVHLGYIGGNANEALSQFSEKLKSAFPGARCGTWQWDGKVSEDKIRSIKEE